MRAQNQKNREDQKNQGNPSLSSGDRPNHFLIPFLERGHNLLWVALGLGLGLRLLSMWFVWGPQALDDYLDALIPAWKHSLGQDPDLYPYRSPLFIWILSAWIRFGSWVGIEAALSQVRWVYFLLALSSLLAIVGIYLLTLGPRLSGSSFYHRLFPTLLAAAYGLIPFVSTRCFLEAFSIGFLTLGLALCERGGGQGGQGEGSWVKPVLGFMALAFACLIRFQVGVIYGGYLLLLLVLFLRTSRLGSTEARLDSGHLRALVVGVIVGFGGLVAEALIDRAYGRYPFQTFLALVEITRGHTTVDGLSPWYNTWLTWGLFLFFPVSFLLPLKDWVRGFRDYWRMGFLILLFVLVHSLLAHKEERYLYPILPLSFLIWGGAWASFCHHQGLWGGVRQRIYLGVFGFFNGLLLIASCWINTQAGEVEAPALIQARSNDVLYLDFDSLVGRGSMYPFFIRPPAILRKFSSFPSGIEDLKALVTKEFQDYDFQQQKLGQKQEGGRSSEGSTRGFVLLTSHSDWADQFKSWEVSRFFSSEGGFTCDPLEEATTLTDRLVYKGNPHRNYRRRPTWYIYCWRGK